MKELFKREPARLIGHSISLLIAALALLSSFGITVSDDQSAAMIGILTTIMVIVSGGTEVIRGAVYSPASINAIKKQTIERVVESVTLPEIRNEMTIKDLIKEQIVREELGDS